MDVRSSRAPNREETYKQTKWGDWSLPDAIQINLEGEPSGFFIERSVIDDKYTVHVQIETSQEEA